MLISDVTRMAIGCVVVIVVAVLFLIYLVINLCSVISEFKADSEYKEFTLKDYIILISFIVFGILIFGGGLAFFGKELVNTLYPPETVTENGYTYRIADDNPDETIEVNGHKYVLETPKGGDGE